MIDQLPAGSTLSTQANFLKQWGIDKLVIESTNYWESMKNAPDVAAMKMRSRSTEVKSLSDSLGLGSFETVFWSVGN